MLEAITRRGVLKSAVFGPYLTPFIGCGCRRHSHPTRHETAVPHSQTQASMAESAMNLVLLGDIMLGRYVNDGFTCEASQKTAAFGDVLPFLHSMDPHSTVIAGNLECAVTSHTQPTPKAFNFRLAPGNADVLQQLRLNFVATANNHVLDYGQVGLLETREVLDRLGVKHAGSGPQPLASQPATVTTPGGHRIAFLSYSDHYEDWAATETTPGINFIDPTSYDPLLLQQQVSAARASGPDLLVVMIHWGPNWRWQPDSSLRKLGQAFLQAGADVVFGTSPHHIQGVEMHGSKPIIYSGGSFIDDYAGDDHYRNDVSAIFVARFVPRQPQAAGPAHTPGADTAPPAAAASPEEGSQAGQLPGCSSCIGPSDAACVLDQAQAPEGHAASMTGHQLQPPAAPSTAAAASAGKAAVPATASTEAHVEPPRMSAAQAGSAAASTASGGRLVLQELVAVPIAITHHWRSEGGPYKEAGHGNPPYFSQVNLAQDDNWSWVAVELQQLSRALGNGDVTVLPERGCIQLYAQGQAAAAAAAAAVQSA